VLCCGCGERVKKSQWPGRFLLAHQLKLPSYYLCSKCRVCFDDKVQISGVDKKVHIPETSPFYVGICKKGTSKNNLDFFVHSRDMDIFVYCKKVGPFGTRISYLNCGTVIFIINSDSTHTPQPTTRPCHSTSKPPHTHHKTHSAISPPNYQPYPHLAMRTMTAVQASTLRRCCG
jgi:hypothetical protein